MPTDLTGTPTSLGIGTYNVDVDAPSGLGFNEAMAQIDALIAARAPKPSSTGVKVWNNTTGSWDAPTGTPDGTKFLRDDDAWATPATPAGLTLIQGFVASNGTINSGTGFTVVKNATGNYTVNFTSAFGGTPGVIAAVDTGASLSVVEIRSVGASSFQVLTFLSNSTGTASDSSFHFFAVGP